MIDSDCDLSNNKYCTTVFVGAPIDLLDQCTRSEGRKE